MQKGDVMLKLRYLMFAGLSVVALSAFAARVSAQQPPPDRPHDQQAEAPDGPDGPDAGPMDGDGPGDDMPPPPGPDGGPGRPGRMRGPGGPLGGPGFRGGPEGKPPLPPMTDEEIGKMLAFAQEHFPEMAKRFEDLKKDDPQEFRRAMRRVWPRMMILRETYARDPELGKTLVEERKLEEQIHTKVRSYRQERDPANKDKIGGELKQLLGQQFDIRLQRRRLELADLQKRLAEQTQRVDAWAAKKQENVQRQFDRITGEDLDW